MLTLTQAILQINANLEYYLNLSIDFEEED